MLTLTINPTEFVQIGAAVRVHARPDGRGGVRISITAPRHVQILRSALLDERFEARRAAAGAPHSSPRESSK